MQTKESIFNQLQIILNELFEIKLSDITLQSKLYEDLDLDSIDAVDLVIKLQELTNTKIKPDEFKLVRSVEDVVDNIFNLVSEKGR